MNEQTEWLKANRCPHCAKRSQPACPYEVREKLGGGYRCHGYESRYWDERIESFKGMIA